MWTKKFWKATTERMIRGGAAALGSALILGDWVVDVMNVGNWVDGLTLFIGGALVSLLMSLAGGKLGSGSGPAFTGQETLTKPLN